MPAFELAPIFGFEASPTCVGGGGTAGFFSRTTPNTPSRRGGARIFKDCAATSQLVGRVPHCCAYSHAA